MKKKTSILVLGSINMDLVLNTERMPRMGESLIGNKYRFSPGGKGANRAVAAVRLGTEVTFIGKIGRDPNGLALKKQLIKENIKTGYLAENGSSTGLAVIILDNEGQNRILVYPGANMELTTEDLKNAFNKKYDAVICELEISIPTVLETFAISQKNNIPFVLDAGPAQKFSLEAVRGLEIISPNETETHTLTGIKILSTNDAAAAAEILAEKTKAKHIVIKMGAKGAFLYSNKKSKFISGFEVDVIDTTAAGDAFTTALTISYIETGDIERAVHFANIVGALTVTKPGAQSSLPDMHDVTCFIKRRDIKW